MIKNIGLKEIMGRTDKFRIELEKDYLKKLMIKASGNKRPHCDKNFITNLGLKMTTRYLNVSIISWLNNGIIPTKELKKVLKLAGTGWNEVEEKTKSIKFGKTGGKISPVFPIEVDYKLGTIIGHLLGDGSIDKKYNQVSFSNSEKALLREFYNNMFQIFQVKPRIWMQKTPKFGETEWDKRIDNLEELIEGRNCSLFYSTTCGLLLKLIMGEFASGKDKRITKEIFESNINFKRGLLRAFFDDEATIGEKNIRVFQDRPEILEELQKLLGELKISPSKITKYKKRDKNRYYFDIFKKSNLRKFEKQIGLSSPKKKEKLHKITSKKPHGNDK